MAGLLVVVGICGLGLLPTNPWDARVSAAGSGPAMNSGLTIAATPTIAPVMATGSVAVEAATWTPEIAFDRHLFPSLVLVSENPGFKLWNERKRSEWPVKGQHDGWLSVGVAAGRDR